MSVALVAGALANKPDNGGEAWVRLSWVLGLQRLGVETWFVEEIAPDACFDEHGAPAPAGHSVNRRWFEQVVARFGLADRASLVEPDGGWVAGAPADALEDAATRADLLLNISGTLTSEPLLSAPRVRVYLDLDPGYTQFWQAAGLLGGQLDRHELLLTVGLAVGTGSCSIPVSGATWRPVPPPVLLEEWPPVKGGLERRFTTVGSWRGGYGRMEHDGRLYGQKAHEFRRFASIPREVDAEFEAALAIEAADRADADRLEAEGWRLADPRLVARDPDAFRAYVQRSPAEFSPAQGIYVETRSGWLGDRTVRYLASGRPAVVQDTGLPAEIPVGEGLMTFRTQDEAVAAASRVLDDYDRHSRAARRLAEELFGSNIVLGAVLGDVLP